MGVCCRWLCPCLCLSSGSVVQRLMPKFDSESVRTDCDTWHWEGFWSLEAQNPYRNMVVCLVWTLSREYGVRLVTTPPHSPLIAHWRNLWMSFTFGRVWPWLLELMTEDSLIMSEHKVNSSRHVLDDDIYFSVCLVRTQILHPCNCAAPSPWTDISSSNSSLTFLFIYFSIQTINQGLRCNKIGERKCRE